MVRVLLIVGCVLYLIVDGGLNQWRFTSKVRHQTREATNDIVKLVRSTASNFWR